MAAPDEADKWAARVEGRGEEDRKREKERRYNGKVNPIIHSTVKQPTILTVQHRSGFLILLR